MDEKSRILLERMKIMFLAMFLLLFIIAARLFYLQVIEADKYKTMSEKNRIALQILPPQRGNVYDRNGVMLAKNEQSFFAAIVAEQSPNVSETLDKVSEILSLEDGDKAAIINNVKRSRKFLPIRIKDNLQWEDVAALELRASELSGVVIEEGFGRFYPDGRYFAHALGYVGAVSEADKQKKDPLFEIPDFKIGKSGVEQSMEDVLRGKSGNVKMEVNAFGRVMQYIDRQEPQIGKTLYLSLDSRLQKKAYELFGDESGALVVMNVRTGEILAYVSVPTFDPNLFVNGMDHKTWNELVLNPKKPLSDKVSSGVYSPGSTFKMMTALAGLKANAIDVSTKIYCDGKYELGGHNFHCWKHSGHGALNVVEALEHSCDVFFYDLSLKVGIEKIAETAREFGLGQESGLGFSVEKSGIIPDKKWKMKRFGKSWQQGESIIASIGQGYVSVTPLQLAVMTARIANGRKKVVPTLIKQDEIPVFEKLKVSRKNIEIVQKGMFEVVNGIGGTAKRAAFDINGAKLAGKTGTTQVRGISEKERKAGINSDKNMPWHLRNHALFVGYAPYDDPLYAVAVIVEHGSSGSAVAAPIGSKILQEAINLNSAK